MSGLAARHKKLDHEYQLRMSELCDRLLEFFVCSFQQQAYARAHAPLFAPEPHCAAESAQSPITTRPFLSALFARSEAQTIIPDAHNRTAILRSKR